MKKNTWIVFSLISDAVFINVAIILAFLIRFAGKLPAVNFQAYTSLAVFITVIQLIALYIYDLYTPEKTQSSWDIFFAILKAATLGVILIVFLTFFYRFFSFPRSVFTLSWVLLIIVLAGWRIVAAKIFSVRFPLQRILVVGSQKTARDIIKELKRRSNWGYDVVGVADRKPEELEPKIEGVPVVGDIFQIPLLVKDLHINRVILATPIRQRELVEEMVKSEEGNIKVEVVPDLYDIFIGKADHNLISDIPLMELTKEAVPNWVHLAKRFMEIFLALFLAILGSPIILVTAILVKFTSRGPVLYKQVRVGRRKKRFNIYKFRTMIKGAENETGPVLAEEKDTRLTSIGGFLRRYRIDEFPQLINILRGNMSFVGPRPERPHFVEKHEQGIPGYAERFRAKPGSTGMAQISGTYATTTQNKLKYDLIYVYHQSLLLDIEILFHTIKVVLTGKGGR